MYGIYANIWGILMVNVIIYSIHGSYGIGKPWLPRFAMVPPCRPSVGPLEAAMAMEPSIGGATMDWAVSVNRHIVNPPKRKGHVLRLYKNFISKDKALLFHLFVFF